MVPCPGDEVLGLRNAGGPPAFPHTLFFLWGQAQEPVAPAGVQHHDLALLEGHGPGGQRCLDQVQAKGLTCSMVDRSTLQGAVSGEVNKDPSTSGAGAGKAHRRMSPGSCE
jgi:hypothetical protein